MLRSPVRSSTRRGAPFPSIAVLLSGTLLLCAMLSAQEEVRPAVGIRQNTPSVHAFTNARIVTAPGKVIGKGTLVIRDGIITAAGAGAAVPADARVWDMTGMTLYPGLIESYSDIGVPKKPKPPAEGGAGQEQPKPAEQQSKGGAKHWNQMVLSSLNADELFVPDPKAAEKLRGIGFTSALVVPQKGIFRGSSAVVSLGEGTASELLLKSHVAQHVAFETSQGDDYPGSLMGAIALIRQTLLDAQWHKQAMQAAAKYPAEPRPEFVADLAALGDAVSAREAIVFETGDELALLRASRIAREFSLQYWARGSGYEYRQLDAVKTVGVPIILPVNFPEAPSVQTPEDALGVSLEELRHWNDAPDNPKKLHDAGIPFVLTTATLKDAAQFPANVRKAIERGLPADAALAALTTGPAKLLGLEKKLGTLEAGKAANFIITDGDLFGEKTKIRETWVDGRRYEVKPKPEYDPRGTWAAALPAAGGGSAAADSLTIVLKGEVDGLQGDVKAKGKSTKITTGTVSDLRLALAFAGDSLGFPAGVVRMTAAAAGPAELLGTGEFADGKAFHWSARRTGPFAPEPDTAKPKPPAAPLSFAPLYPPGSFGRTELPAQPDRLLIRGATVWTCGPQGKLDNADVLVERGKIVKVGRQISAPADALVVDGTGKHVTPGLIDCHSHTGVEGSVNEANEAISAEVRIGDVLDPYDISIYRELAGGLSVANVLHGSANAIGGENQVIKLRWGSLPEQMKFEGAMPGIKFALGENPKQSNWGEKYVTRYPQTRQGVEQIIRDEFRAALDYERAWKEFAAGSRKIPPRRELWAETILEVLKGKRLVHAHSYRQDEVEMLMRVAEDFGFRISSFQHILEGYKVADQMAKHGATASTFSDWWAYKFEVYDAIPYNGALMRDAGVVVSFNSDSDELARHLNTEAAKAVKYGGVSEEEALKFVTINPARQLHIEKRVGSLEAGKDADIAVWNGSPLSTYSVCEQTWIDGRKYFDRDEDRAMSREIERERAALAQRALGSKKGGGAESKPPASMGEKEAHSCHDDDQNTGKGDR